MTEFGSVIDQDWDEIAIDNGSFVSQFSGYSAKIYPRSGANSTEILKTEVEGISYTPEVNSVKGLSVDVEPFSKLEGEDYLGGIIDVFVDGEPLFSGEISKINTHQNDDGFYSIDAEPPGKKIRDETINESVQRRITQDYITKTTLKYNNYHGEHFNFVGTGDESLTDMTELDSRTRKADVDNATATYFFSEYDASDIERVYFKVQPAPSTGTDVEVLISTYNSSYTEKFETGLSGEDDLTGNGDYGEWVSFAPDSSLDSDSYEMKFTFLEGVIIYDWIVLSEQSVNAVVEPESANVSLQDERVQGDDSGSFTKEMFDFSRYGGETTTPFNYSNGTITPLQTNFVKDFSGSAGSGSGGERTNVNFSGGDASYLGGSLVENGDTVTINFSTDYNIKDFEIYVREKTRKDSSHDVAYLPGIDLVVNGNRTSFINEGPLGNISLTWNDISQSLDTNLDGSSTVELEVVDTSTNFDNEPDYSGYDEYIVDVISVQDGRFNFSLDNTVHQDNGYLDHPSEFSTVDPIFVDFAEVEYAEIVDEATINVTSSTGQVHELAVSFSGGTEYQTSSNDVSSTTLQNEIISSTTQSRIGFIGRSPSGDRSQTPRQGYDTPEVSEYETLADTSDVGILHNMDFNGNRLKVISDIADNSNYFYRWEGNQIRVFKRESRTTSVDLKKEEIESSVSIEDVYSSCEVIGEGGITSGIVEADNAPSYVDRHKEIRDPDVSNNQDAERKAREFLRKNGEIEYEGNITTLPTLAPLGELMDGSVFNHGKDSFIERVRYTKRRSDISLGKSKEVKDELIKLDRSNSSSNVRNTS